MGARKRAREANDGRTSTTTTKRRRRTRRVPKVLEAKDLDAIAQRRCLMILSVLSGEKTVTEVVTEAQISPTQYNILEARAVQAMLAALLPGAGEAATRPRTEQLEAKVVQLEREKRRSERLLWLTRQVVKPGPMKTTRGRPTKQKKRQSSTSDGSARSSSSSQKTTTSASSSTSTPTPAGAVARSSGTESSPAKT